MNESTDDGDRDKPISFISCQREGVVTKHVFEGSFRDGSGPHEVWKCASCGERRVWGNTRIQPRVAPIKNWLWEKPQGQPLSAGQLKD